MTKVIYVIPGFTEQVKEKKYNSIIWIFKENKFKVIPVSISWKYKTMDDYVQEFLTQFTQHNITDDIYILGFSFGAMISLIASTRVKIKTQFLCSLSPYFKEDLLQIKESWKGFIGKRRLENFEKLSFDALSKKVVCKTFIFAGTKEGDGLQRRALIAKKRIKNSKLIMIDGGKHDISQNIYVKKLEECILENLT